MKIFLKGCHAMSEHLVQTKRFTNNDIHYVMNRRVSSKVT